MQITELPGAEQVELQLAGRIDATWAEHLSATIEKSVRAGAHRVVLNFAAVDYISSLGIRVLLVQYKLLKSVKGSLVITHATDFCRNVLITVGLNEILSDDDPAAAPEPVATPKQRRGGADYEVYPQAVTKPLTCALIGDPARLTSTGFTAADCRNLTFATGSFGLGLGAFGQGYDDCANRFGEFLAAGGCAVALPTSDPQSLPDYVVEEGTLVPQVETLYALSGAGDFSTMIRFDSASDGPGKIGLSELIDSLIDISSSQTIAFVVLAEAAGIVGATLRKSPAGQPLVPRTPRGPRLALVHHRTQQRKESRAARRRRRPLHLPDHARAKFLRPMKTDSAISAHIHAAVFPYRPVQRGELPFGSTVADLLNASSPSAVLHLMADTRPFEGVGETDLARGACWLGPVSLNFHHRTRMIPS